MKKSSLKRLMTNSSVGLFLNLCLSALVVLGASVKSARGEDPSANIVTPKNPTGDADQSKEPIGAIMELKVPKGAKVFFRNLKNGQKIKKDTDFKVLFGVKGMALKPAGDLSVNTGHHHLVIDGLPVDKGTPVPFDDRHHHFGKGQMETTIKLPAGKHSLILQFANGAHLSYGPELSATIDVIAE
jgi:hypothetical protein